MWDASAQQRRHFLHSDEGWAQQGNALHHLHSTCCLSSSASAQDPSLQVIWLLVGAGQGKLLVCRFFTLMHRKQGDMSPCDLYKSSCSTHAGGAVPAVRGAACW